MRLIKIIGKEEFEFEDKVKAVIGIGLILYLWSKMSIFSWARKSEECVVIRRTFEIVWDGTEKELCTDPFECFGQYWKILLRENDHSDTINLELECMTEHEKSVDYYLFFVNRFGSSFNRGVLRLFSDYAIEKNQFNEELGFLKDGKCRIGIIMANLEKNKKLINVDCNVWGDAFAKMKHVSGSGILCGRSWRNWWVYIGRIKGGKKEGKGIIITHDDYEKEKFYVYDGDWKDNEKHGKGLEVYPGIRSYEGEFRYGRRLGNGVGVWIDSIRYEGRWDDKFHGEGTLWFKDGRVYVGWFNNGELCGHGVMIYPDGYVVEKDWDFKLRNTPEQKIDKSLVG